MTVTSTVFGILLIPLLLVLYAGALDVDIPRENIVATLVLLLVPVAVGMVLRRLNANSGAVLEFAGSALGLFFILFLVVSWIPRNWGFLLSTGWATYAASIGLGLMGIAVGYLFARGLKLHPRNARTVALETGIQNGPLAVAIVAFTWPAEEAQALMAVPVLYSLFIVIISASVTMVFRRANLAAEQKMPDGLL
jgi:BASS family bile acid:Na+ symporter